MQESPLQEVAKTDVGETIKAFLNWGIHIGEGEKSINITVGLLLLLGFAFLLTSLILKWIRLLITRKMEQDDRLKFISLFSFVQYFIYLLVVVLTMSAAGIDITLIITASAALFVGLGLALQDLFQDILGGLFIIIDKSLTVGDVIEVDSRVGKVTEIKLRSTRALTRDDKVMVIPNHKFIGDTIFNYTQNRRSTREKVLVGVAYGSNVDLVAQLLEKVAHSQQGVLKNPKPLVLFEDFGDSALIFSINFHVGDSFMALRTKSEMRFKINREFAQNNISIPFPQRDVHLIPYKSGE